MKGILADHNIGGHLNVLLSIWQSERWRDFWTGLSLSLYSFADFGLDSASIER